MRRSFSRALRIGVLVLASVLLLSIATVSAEKAEPCPPVPSPTAQVK
ncbi:hypothetical protein [Limnochorda pilosa]|uniref:Uncharacterized protein n=1 Tax=Limnochorda pilosa TaxID=1555112 RepID=A0A0K2SL66_LIMPI|nr:hypothetical protein [Limnochorda pilosa]BAS27858.1 hypothetical protein LIP_2017 [Limnochorda pilosa]